MQTVGQQSVSWAAVTAVTGTRGGEDDLAEGQSENQPHVMNKTSTFENARCSLGQLAKH